MPPGMRPIPQKKHHIDPPENLRDLPRFLKELIGGFFVRFAYIVKLVWDTDHSILFFLSFMALFKGVAPVVGALISRELLNELQGIVKLDALPISQFWTSTIFYLLIFQFIYRLLLQIVNNLNRAINRIAGEKVVKQVKLRIMEKSKELDLGSFDDPEFYERMENANREAGHRPLSILTETFSLVSTGIELVSYLLIILSAPGLGLATLMIIAVSIPSAIINFIYRRKNFQYMRWRSKDRRQMEYYSSTLVNKDLIKEIRMFDLGDLFIGRYLEVFANYYKGLRKLIISENIWHIVAGILSGLTNLAFCVLIGLRVYTGEFMIGDFSLYTGAIASVATCIGTLISSSGAIYEGTLFIDNLILFMKEKQTIFPRLETPATVEESAGHTIEFKNVSFRYPGTKRNVLQNITLTLHPGETMALVGLNGAGKTTLIKLLMRLYDPTEGDILLDGKNIKDYDLKSLYRAFGIIFQDFGKYAVTVEENIRFGAIHKNAPMDQVEFAAKQSAAEDYITQLPDGYQTPLMRFFEPNGLELSIGQWQKLAIARAFYSDAEILILDEPTASLDAIAEQEIFNQFDQLRSNKTTIFVSHRLSSATMADQIIVLENGCLIEKGTHAELMEMKGKYAKLFSTQAKRYLETKKE